MLTLIQSHPASLGPHSGAGQAVGVTVINYNTVKQTLRCIASLGACTEPPAWIEVLDNASEPNDISQLQIQLPTLPHTQIRLYRSETNLGFAAGSNYLIAKLLQTPQCQYIGLLNNDAVAKPAWVSELVNALETEQEQKGMAGGRMHKLEAPDQVDTLGICLYASLMPADRHDPSDPYLGPTGGCCLMTRTFLNDVIHSTGYLFDERYFCYCEDTDLVLRARLLGYSPAYTDELIALHQGQASSGRNYNSFIAYHGLRNLIWMQLKLFPASLLCRHGLWLALAHLLAIARQMVSGHPIVVCRTYRDGFRMAITMRSEHKKIKNETRISLKKLQNQLSKKFYRKGYLSFIIRKAIEKKKLIIKI
jgi:GT2 family glycosyltransferase